MKVTCITVLLLFSQVLVDCKWACSNCGIQYQAVGCYKDNSKRPLPHQLLNERDPHSKVYGGRRIDWINWNAYIAGFACRCAALAKAKGYTVFGLQFYGECWSGPELENYKSVGKAEKGSCIGPDYKPCSPWDRHCVGKQFMNFVYKIVPDCDIPLESVGCYSDRHIKDNRPLPSYIMTDRDASLSIYSGRSIDWRNWDVYMPELVCRCAKKAKSMGKTTFGIEYYGECWAAGDSDITYGKDGLSGNCIDKCYENCKPHDKYCSGKQFANFVYRLADSPCEWKTTPVGCYKEDKDSRALNTLILSELEPSSDVSDQSAFRGNVFDPTKWSTEFPKLLCRCARAAKSRGFTVFGVHNTGSCWASSNSEAYKKHGASSECIKESTKCSSNSENCAGDSQSVFVYKVSAGGSGSKRSFNPKLMLNEKSIDDLVGV